LRYAPIASGEGIKDRGGGGGVVLVHAEGKPRHFMADERQTVEAMVRSMRAPQFSTCHA